MAASPEDVKIRICAMVGIGIFTLSVLTANSARGRLQAKPAAPAPPKTAVTPPGPTTTPNVIVDHRGELSDTNLVFVGRWDRSDPMAAHSYWGGAYLRAKFTGTAIAFLGRVTSGGDTLLVSIDGEVPREVKTLARKDLTPGAHTILVGSPGQNSEIEFRGLTLAAGASTLPLPPRPIIEFIGDSITTGGGRKLPSTVNYAWLTAESLKADHTQIAFSARALTSGFGCVDDKTGLDTQYFQTETFNSAPETQHPWPFTYKPRIVVINLGQNDQCGSEPDATFETTYHSFISQIREKLPKAYIVALRPFSGAYGKDVQEVVRATVARGDDKVKYVDTTGWLDKGDFVDGIHPTDAGHAKASKLLVMALQPLMATGKSRL